MDSEMANAPYPDCQANLAKVSLWVLIHLEDDFKIFDRLTDGDGAAKVKEKMDVVFDGVDENRVVFKILQDSRNF